MSAPQADMLNSQPAASTGEADKRPDGHPSADPRLTIRQARLLAPGCLAAGALCLVL
jgi:hypothetical protein